MAQRGTNPRRKPAAKGALLPLDYMLAVINDPTADVERRDRMAICAAQYCHPRVAKHPKGKKVLAAEAAAEAGGEWGGDLAWQQ